MPKMIDVTGKRFGRLTVVKLSGRDAHNHPLWECVCDCGNVIRIPSSRLRSGNTSSCGCLHNEQLAVRNTRHGDSRTRMYHIYKGMKSRCYREKDASYPDYGGRGIEICSEWLGSRGFENFREWAVTHGYSDGLSIDRIDHDGPYSPNNCRWATNTAQANNRRNNRIIEIDGVTHTLSEWGEITGTDPRTIEARLRTLGWDAKKAVFTAKRGVVNG